MIKHIVFFKLEDNTSDKREVLKAKLLAMKGKIDILKHIEVGIDINGSERAYDVALITDFQSIEDLKSYASNPLHVEVLKYLKSENILTKVVDYEY